MRKSTKQALPPIPDKRYFTISEVSYLCGVKAYVLRYWEQEFTQLCPVKRRGNRRFYQKPDILLVRQIKALLYEAGFTIEGARMQLANKPDGVVTTAVSKPSAAAKTINSIIDELEAVLQHLHAGLAMQQKNS